MFNDTVVYFSCQLIEPYGGGAIPELNGPPEQKYEVQENPSEKSVSHRRSNSNFRSMSPDIDSKDIKNIYVDSKLISQQPMTDHFVFDPFSCLINE